MSAQIRLVEVGPRDGLQNEARRLDPQARLALIRRLAATGLETIEVGAMVSPARVPQMEGSDTVLAGLDLTGARRYPVLVPNLRGLEAAMAVGVRDIAVFGSASETFSQKNIGCSIDDSLRRFEAVCERALDAGIRVRGYLSCVVGCPYEGAVDPARVARLAGALHALGCEDISLGDTIGIGTPGSILTLLDAVGRVVPMRKLAGHYHDTRGMAIANIYASIEAGVRCFDTAIGGLGGCPYARGASGNVATEEVVWLLEGLGYRTGIDLGQVVDTAWEICTLFGRQPGKLARALRPAPAAPLSGQT